MLQLCNSGLQSHHRRSGNTPLKRCCSVFPLSLSLCSSEILIYWTQPPILPSVSSPLCFTVRVMLPDANSCQLVCASFFFNSCALVGTSLSFNRTQLHHRGSIFLLAKSKRVMCAPTELVMEIKQRPFDHVKSALFQVECTELKCESSLSGMPSQRTNKHEQSVDFLLTVIFAV